MLACVLELLLCVCVAWIVILLSHASKKTLVYYWVRNAKPW